MTDRQTDRTEAETETETETGRQTDSRTVKERDRERGRERVNMSHDKNSVYSAFSATLPFCFPHMTNFTRMIESFVQISDINKQ